VPVSPNLGGVGTKRLRRRILYTIAALAMLVGALEVWSSGFYDRPLAIQSVAENNRSGPALEVNPEAECGDVTVRVEETPDIVRLWVTQRRSLFFCSRAGDQDRQFAVSLKQPLGDRLVMRGDTDDEIVVQRRLTPARNSE